MLPDPRKIVISSGFIGRNKDGGAWIKDPYGRNKLEDRNEQYAAKDDKELMRRCDVWDEKYGVLSRAEYIQRYGY